MIKKQGSVKRIVNRRASYDYILGDSVVVGLQLSGAETKALRMGHGQLSGAYITIKNGELWLINSLINSSSGVLIEKEDQTRSRKLLAKRNEIAKLTTTKQQGKTIVPLEFLTTGRYIKLRIATGQGKKLYDKRANLKARDEARQINARIKGQNVGPK